MGQIKRGYFPTVPLDWINCSFGKFLLPGYNVGEGISGFGPLYVLRYSSEPSYKISQKQ